MKVVQLATEVERLQSVLRAKLELVEQQAERLREMDQLRFAL